MGIESINPADGVLIRKYDEYDETMIETRLNAATETFQRWRNEGFEKKSGLMLNASKYLKLHRDDLAASITREMGKPITDALAEVDKCALACEYYAENAPRFLASRQVVSDADESFVRYDPIGPVLAVMPWNFPFWQVFRFAAPALMAGNVGVLKHASNVPECALKIERVFLEAGFPEGAFTTLLISAKKTARVIGDSRIAAVTLTGSTPAGEQVAAQAGAVLKKTVLELGGSDPFIVLKDADIARAAEVAALSRAMNTGQSCIAAKRFIVEEPVVKEFTSAFKGALSALKMGDPMEKDTALGPMAREDLREELHDQVVRSKKQGARVVLGGEIPSGPGYFYPATLLVDVTPDMVVAKEETFGPVAPVIPAKDLETAIALANDSEFGLGSAVWTRNVEVAKEAARRIESGAVFVNGLVKSDPRLPFGGIKRSGYGRELAEEGIREFTNIKTVWMAR